MEMTPEMLMALAQALKGQGGQQQAADNAYKFFSPEEIQQLSSLGSVEDRQALLQQQMARAEALRNQPTPQHSTGVGAALGGLGNVISAIRGKGQAEDAQAQQKALLDKQDQMRALFGDFPRRMAAQEAMDKFKSAEPAGVKFAPPPPPQAQQQPPQWQGFPYPLPY